MLWWKVRIVSRMLETWHSSWHLVGKGFFEVWSLSSGFFCFTCGRWALQFLKLQCLEDNDAVNRLSISRQRSQRHNYVARTCASMNEG